MVFPINRKQKSRSTGGLIVRRLETEAFLSRNMALRRALHFVFKIGDRAKTATFYRDVLGMKVGVSKVKN